MRLTRLMLFLYYDMYFHGLLILHKKEDIFFAYILLHLINVFFTEKDILFVHIKACNKTIIIGIIRINKKVQKNVIHKFRYVKIRH